MAPSPPPSTRLPAPPFAHAAVLGGGLVGGSLAEALRGRAVADRVTVLDAASSVCDFWADRGFEAVTGPPFPDPAPDLVCLAAPPRANLDWLAEIARSLPNALLTDVTSVKRPIVSAAARLRESSHPGLRFVGSHPIAGAETSGPAAARADLFVGRTVVLCALPGTAPALLQAVERTWRLLGGVPVEMSADDHDALVAATSHLPQVVASMLAAHVGDRLLPGDPGEALIGPGLRDTTRLASSSTPLWDEILAANEENVRREAGALARRLAAWAEADRGVWRRDLEAGAAARARWGSE